MSPTNMRLNYIYLVLYQAFKPERSRSFYEEKNAPSPIATDIIVNMIQPIIASTPSTIPAISKPLPLKLAAPFFILLRSTAPNMIGIIDIPKIPVTRAAIDSPLGPSFSMFWFMSDLLA